MKNEEALSVCETTYAQLTNVRAVEIRTIASQKTCKPYIRTRTKCCHLLTAYNEEQNSHCCSP